MSHTHTFDMEYHFDRKGVSEDKHNNVIFVYVTFPKLGHFVPNLAKFHT